MPQLPKHPKITERLRALAVLVAGPVATVLLSVAAMAQALKVWQWRPGDPVDLSGDSAPGLAQVKDILDHGWYGSNPDLGAPFHQDASWFPYADQLHLFLTGRVIGLFSDNPFTIGAIYFFLGFPLAALSMYWLARQRHLGRPGSMVAGVLFSVLPGHQSMFQHLWLASYWVVPLGIWLVLRAALGEPLFRLRVDWRDPGERRSALPLNLTTAFCVFCIGLGGIYFSAFTLLLLAATAVVRLVATRDRRSIAGAAGLLIAVGGLSLAAVLSVAVGQDKSTVAIVPALRGPGESEMFAGKLMDLILPWIHHRMGALQSLTAGYNTRTTAPTFEETAIGVIALAGVVALLVIMLSALVPARVKPADPQLGMLGVLTLVALSFYSIGGLGSFVAQFVTPQIRTWSRLSIVITLFGLLAVGHWVTVLNRKNRILGILTAAALITVGVLDQTNPAMAPNYQVMRTEVAGLATFSKQIEAKTRPGCSVFQLPIEPFPEAYYSHLLPYLTSPSLRWSFGAIRGTALADWQLALPQTSTTTMVNDLVAAGFCAVEVNRATLVDPGTTLTSDLTALLGEPISTTPDTQLLAWDLTRASTALTAQVGPAHVKATGELVLHPVVVYSASGAYEVEHDNLTPYQRTGSSPVIDIHNFGRTTVDGVRLSFSLAAPDSSPRHFTVHSPGGKVLGVDVNGGSAQQVHLVVNAVPGRNPVTITITGEAVDGTNVGKLIDLRASVPESDVRVGVIQQRLG